MVYRLIRMAFQFSAIAIVVDCAVSTAHASIITDFTYNVAGFTGNDPYNYIQQDSLQLGGSNNVASSTTPNNIVGSGKSGTGDVTSFISGNKAVIVTGTSALPHNETTAVEGFASSEISFFVSESAHFTLTNSTTGNIPGLFYTHTALYERFSLHGLVMNDNFGGTMSFSGTLIAGVEYTLKSENVSFDDISFGNGYWNVDQVTSAGNTVLSTVPELSSFALATLGCVCLWVGESRRRRTAV